MFLRLTSRRYDNELVVNINFSYVRRFESAEYNKQDSGTTIFFNNGDNVFVFETEQSIYAALSSTVDNIRIYS